MIFFLVTWVASYDCSSWFLGKVTPDFAKPVVCEEVRKEDSFAKIEDAQRKVQDAGRSARPVLLRLGPGFRSKLLPIQWTSIARFQ